MVIIDPSSRHVTADDQATQIPNFKNIRTNSWPTDYNSLTTIFAYFHYLRMHMIWLETDGKQLLEGILPLTMKEYEQLAAHIDVVVGELPKLKPVILILQQIIKRGTDSLKELVDKKSITEIEALDYANKIMKYLRNGGPCGQSGHNCTLQESVKMIDALVPIAQACKSIDILYAIANCRYSGHYDALMHNLYLKNFKNWED